MSQSNRASRRPGSTILLGAGIVLIAANLRPTIASVATVLDQLHAGLGLSTMAQSFGYPIAGLGPLTMGILHEITGSWTPTVAVLFALLVPRRLAGLASARDRRIQRGPALTDSVTETL